MTTGAVHLAGLSKADAIELAEFVDRENTTFADEGLSDGDFGDIGALTAIVVLSIPALRGLVAYLAYRYRGKSFEQTIEVERADGTRVRTTITWRDTSSEPIDASIARDLASLSGIPLEQIVDHAG